MDSLHSTTDRREKNRHLTLEDRVVIQTMHKQGCSNRAIARELNCSPATITYELRRGTVLLYNGHVARYKAKEGQRYRKDMRKNCGAKNQRLHKSKFIKYVETKVLKYHWSLDACVGRALESGKFQRDEIVCTKTLYNYVDLGLLNITNSDLPEKLSRKPKHKRVRENKRKLGRSIEERDSSIKLRSEFGHWECDLVIGRKVGQECVLLTIYERKTRKFIIIKLADKKSTSVMQAFAQLQASLGDKWNTIFKTITTDNGSEFADLSNLEEVSKTLIYYAHPYTSCDKGGVERHNRLIRRFIPKGKSINYYSLEDISEIELWCNNLPRKILKYKTPDEMFEEEIDKLYEDSLLIS